MKKAGNVFLLALFALAVWLYPVGMAQLEPDPSFALDWAPRLAPDVGDSWALAAATTGLLQLLSAGLLIWGLRKTSGRWFPACLATVATFAGSSEGWMLTNSLEQALIHLLIVVFFLGFLFEKYLALFLATLLLLPLSLATAIALLIALGIQNWLDEQPGRPLYVTCGATALILAAHSFWPPTGIWLWLLPLAVHLHPEYAFLAVFYLLSAGMGSGGDFGPGLASGMVLGQAWLTQWESSEPSNFETEVAEGLRTLSLPKRSCLKLALILLLVVAVLPGEQRLNRELLIGSQKVGLKLPQLFQPQSLKEWTLLSGERYGLVSSDLILAEELARTPGPVTVLSFGEKTGRWPAAVLSTLSGKNLEGYAADGTLLPGPTLAKELSRPEILDGELVAVRGYAGNDSPLETIWQGENGSAIFRLPKRANPALEIPDLPEMLAPGVLLDLGVEGLSYQVWREGEKWGRPVHFPAGTPSSFLLPTKPGSYEIEFESGKRLGPFRSDLPSTLSRLKAEFQGEPYQVRPSRTPLRVRLRLTNNSEFPLPLAWVEAVRFNHTGSPLKEDNPRPFVRLHQTGQLAPEESVELETWWLIPPTEGEFEVSLTLRGRDGLEHTIPFDPPLRLQTWRRVSPTAVWE